MLNLNNRPPSIWRKASIPKKDGSLRHLIIPSDELKKVQREILDHLYGCDCKIHSCVCGFMPEKCAMTGVTRHALDASVIVCVDVHDFFPSFPVSAVKEHLYMAKLSDTQIRYILSMCTYRTRDRSMIPQGAPTSAYLTNIGMFSFDIAVSGIAKRLGFVYTRYADDLSFSSKDQTIDREHDVKVLLSLVGKELQKMGLRLAREKTQVIYRNSPKVPRRITGVTIRKDGKGYNAPIGFRKITRAKVHDLYNRLKRGENKDSLRHLYREVLGRVQYCDFCRSASPDEPFNLGDPKIKKHEWEFIRKEYSCR